MIRFFGMAADEQFEVVFEGEAVKNGEMDVRALAPSLLALADLFQESNRVLNGDRAGVSVSVRAEFAPGSFHIDLTIAQNLYEQAKQLILGKEISDAKKLIETIFYFVGLPVSGGVGLFKLIRGMQNKKPASVTYIDNRVQLFFDGRVVEAHEDAYRLWLDDRVLRAAGEFVRPLDRDGIDSVEARYGNLTETIRRAEREVFELPDQGAMESSSSGTDDLSSTRVALLKVVKLSFEKNQKWRFSDGSAAFNASITDQQFISRLNAREEGFYSGDVLKVMLSTSQALNLKGGISTHYTIDRVIEHLAAPRQSDIFDGPTPPKRPGGLWEGAERWKEIQHWIDSRADIDNIEAVVILDDIATMGPLSDRHICTQETEGLTFAHAERAILLLGR